ERQLVDFQSRRGLVLQSEIFGKQNRTGRQNRGTEQRIFQLSYIPRPSVRFEQPLCFRRDTRDLDAHFAVDLVDEIADQKRNISTSFTQRRQINRNHISSHIELLTTPYLLSRL